MLAFNSLNIFNILMLILILVIQAVLVHPQSTSIPATYQYNQAFVTGRVLIKMDLGSGYGWREYTSPLMNTINTIHTVHYSTYSIYAPIYAQEYPLNNNKDNLEYRIDYGSATNTQLVTRITGFLYDPQFKFIGYNYLVILVGFPLYSYMTMHLIEFKYDNSSWTGRNIYQTVNLPTYYQNYNDVVVLFFLRDIKLQYYHSVLNSGNNRIKIDVVYYRQGSNQIQCRIDVANYMQTSGTFFVIRYFVIIYDRVTIAAVAPNYQFAGRTDSNSGPNILGVHIDQNYSTLFFGLKYVQFICDSEPSWKYTLTPYSTSYSGSFQGSSASYHFTAWATIYYGCPSGSYIYTLSGGSRTCTFDPSCPAGQYRDLVNNVCSLCVSPCVECYSPTDCKTCDTSNSVWVNFSCVAAPGFFSNNGLAISPCDSICATCSTIATNCTSCPVNTFLVGQTCLQCYDLFQGCSLCSRFQCYTCNSSYHWINQTYCNVNCNSPRCQQCWDSNTSHCVSCHKPYLLKDGYCYDVCGNGILMPQEQCDDGNLDRHDGCDQLCQVQQNYNCTNATSIANYSFTAYCSYLAPIRFRIISVEKLEGSNALRTVITVQQYDESFWIDHQTFGKHVSFNVSHRNVEAQFIGEWSFSDSRRLLAQEDRQLLEVRAGTYPSGQLVAVEFEYQQSVQDETVDMTLDFSQNRDPRVSTIPPETVSFKATPENNQLAYVYSDETYEQWSLVRNCLLFICIAYFALYVLTLYLGNKRIIAEGMMVVQTTYAALAACPALSPLFSAVTVLSMSFNPQNVMYSQSFRPFDDPLLPNRLRGTNLYAFFLYNFNSGMLFIMVPLLMGIIHFLVSKCWCMGELRQERVANLAQFFLGEYVFSGIVMMGGAIAMASCLQLQFGLTDLNEGMLSVVAMSIMLFLLLVYALAWAKWSHLFGEYYQALLPGVSCVFYFFYFILGPVASTVHYMFYSSSFSSGIVAAYALLLLLFVLVTPVFKKARDRIRVQINLIVVILTQLPFLFAQFSTNISSTLATSIQLLIPLTVPIFLTISFLVNLAVLIYLIALQIKSCFCPQLDEKAVEQALKQEKQLQAFQHHQQLIKLDNQTLSTPLQAIIPKLPSPKGFRDRFIDPEEEEVCQKKMTFRKAIDQFLVKEQIQAKKRIEVNEGSEIDSSGEDMAGNMRKRRRLKYTNEDYILSREYNNIDQI